VTTKAGDAFRMMARAADENPETDFSTSIVSGAVTHMAVDLDLSKEQVADTVSRLYELLEPGFPALRKAKHLTSYEDIAAAAKEGAADIARHQAKGQG